VSRRLGLLLLLILILAGGWWWQAGMPGVAGDGAPAAGGQPSPLAVELTTVQQQAMPLTLHAVGQVEPVKTVSIRAQVSGLLKKVAFTEGERVDAGQLLFEIDPRPFEADVAQAKAALQRDQAALANAQKQYQRLAPLAKEDFVTASELSDASTAVKQARAAVAADQAQLEAAQIKLTYTRITAPIRGRTGAVALDAGNLVDANAATPLVVINQIAPINVRFTVPQTALAQVREYQSAGTIQVAIDADDARSSPVPAQLIFVDNSVAENTGTVVLKAQAENSAGRLWPGEVVSVAVTLTVQQDALVVPTIAVQPGQDGSYVFVVRDGVAHVQPITIARQQDGASVIEDGLQAGDRIVARVPRNLADGSSVQAIPTTNMAAGEQTQDSS